MKSSAIIDVVAIQIELTIQDAIALCQGETSASERLLSHVRGQLRGAAGIDPDNGERADGQLQVRRSTPALMDSEARQDGAADVAANNAESSRSPERRKAGTTLAPFTRLDGSQGNEAPKEYPCPHCERAMRSEQGLKTHIGRMHPPEVDVSQNEPEPMGQANAVPCPHCERTLDTEIGLKIHIGRMHSAAKAEGGTSEPDDDDDDESESVPAEAERHNGNGRRKDRLGAWWDDQVGAEPNA